MGTSSYVLSFPSQLFSMRSPLRVIALALVCLGGAVRAHAQEASDPFTAMRFQFGPVGFSPTLQLSNLGTDDNVFNEAADPKKDTTAAIGPNVDIVLRAGRSRLVGKTGGQYLYFQTYDNQRAWNTNVEGTWRFPMVRLVPFIMGKRSNTKDRPGFEIDSRARLDSRAVGFGTDIVASSKTTFVLTGTRDWAKYDENQTFLGVDLGQRLNRHSDTEQLDARFKLTPLTTLVVRAKATQDRFDGDSVRNTDSYAVMPGFELQPQALISGEVFVGVRRFTTLNSALPDYSGVVASVRAKYAVAATRLAVNVSRDVAYSYEQEQPFYLLTDVGGEVTQRITHIWDVVARGARQRLAYKNLVTLPNLPERVDRPWYAGAGVGYRVGETLRLGFDVNYYRRTMGLANARNYSGLRLGGSLSYGLPQ